MPYSDFPFPLSGGLDRSIQPGRANPATLYKLQNLRPTRFQAGGYEQTLRFSSSSLSLGTIYDPSISATRAESSGDQILMSGGGVILTMETVRDSTGTQIQVFRQTT